MDIQLCQTDKNARQKRCVKSYYFRPVQVLVVYATLCCCYSSSNIKAFYVHFNVDVHCKTHNYVCSQRNRAVMSFAYFVLYFHSSSNFACRPIYDLC